MQRVDDWLAAVAEAVAEGFTEFIVLMGVDDQGLEVWLRLANAAGAHRVLITKVHDDRVPSIIDHFPEAAWDERETAEMFGITFVGHETGRLLLAPEAPFAPMRKASPLIAREQTPHPSGKRGRR